MTNKPASSSLLHKYWLPVLVIFILVGAASLSITAAIKRNLHQENSTPELETETLSEETTPAEPTVPEFINLQPVVDEWLAGLPSGAEVGLMIYDLDHDQVAAEYHPNEVFNAASIYKLLFAYDGYRQIEHGLESSTDPFVFASDDFHSGWLTFGNCLDLIIRESYNTCADPLRSDSERYARAEALAAELGLGSTSGAGLYSSAADLTEILKLYYSHPDLSEDSWNKIQDSMLNQPATTYDWRQGLPSGFTADAAKVYNKVGWAWNRTYSYWEVYDDAAIIDFVEQNRHYIVVIMTSYLPDATPLVNLGSALEATVLSYAE